MSGFEWDEGVEAAEMNAGQTKQVLTYSRELIVQLDQRRHWAVCVITLNPTMPAVLRPDAPNEHHFIKLQRKFVLRHEPEKHLWKLCFKGRMIPPPNGNGDAPIVVERTTVESDTISVVVRERRRKRSEMWTAWALDLFLHLSAVVSGWRIPARMRRFTEVNAESFAAMRARLVETRVAFERRRDAIAAAIARIEAEFSGSTEQQPYACGRYERRTMWLSGVPVELNTLVSDATDWDSWPFGKRLEEDMLLD